MNNFLVVALSLCISVAFSAPAAPSEPKNFLEAVESGDVSAVESLARVNGSSCHDLRYFDGITKAAELGSLEDLKILVKHRCMIGENVFLHDQLLELANSNGRIDVFRWLYSKSGLSFSQIDYIQNDIKIQINDALMIEDLETVKFLLSLPLTSDSMVTETLAKSKNKRLCIWIKQNEPILKHLKSGDLEKINIASLHEHFIEFILSPHSANFSETVIRYLVNILLRNYHGSPLETLEVSKAQHLKYELLKIADFLQRLIEIRQTLEYKALDVQRVKPIRGQPYYEVASANRAIEEKIHQFQSNSMASFVKEIRDGKN